MKQSFLLALLAATATSQAQTLVQTREATLSFTTGSFTSGTRAAVLTFDGVDASSFTITGATLDLTAIESLNGTIFSFVNATQEGILTLPVSTRLLTPTRASSLSAGGQLFGLFSVGPTSTAIYSDGPDTYNATRLTIPSGELSSLYGGPGSLSFPIDLSYSSSVTLFGSPYNPMTSTSSISNVSVRVTGTLRTQSAPVPENSSLFGLGLGALGLLTLRSRRN